MANKPLENPLHLRGLLHVLVLCEVQILHQVRVRDYQHSLRVGKLYKDGRKVRDA